MTHICVSDLTSIGSDKGLSPDRRQAIIRTNAGILLIRPLGTNFTEFLVEILIFSFKKMRLKVSPVKRRPFCLGLNELTDDIFLNWRQDLKRFFGRHWEVKTSDNFATVMNSLWHLATHEWKWSVCWCNMFFYIRLSPPHPVLFPDFRLAGLLPVPDLRTLISDLVGANAQTRSLVSLTTRWRLKMKIYNIINHTE